MCSPFTSPKARLKHSSIKFTLLYPEGSLAEERPENLGPIPQAGRQSSQVLLAW